LAPESVFTGLVLRLFFGCFTSLKGLLSRICLDQQGALVNKILPCTRDEVRSTVDRDCCRRSRLVNLVSCEIVKWFSHRPFILLVSNHLRQHRPFYGRSARPGSGSAFRRLAPAVQPAYTTDSGLFCSLFSTNGLYSRRGVYLLALSKPTTFLCSTSTPAPRTTFWCLPVGSHSTSN